MRDGGCWKFKTEHGVEPWCETWGEERDHEESVRKSDGDVQHSEYHCSKKPRGIRSQRLLIGIIFCNGRNASR
jgi:hypothetical protein